MLQQFGDRRRHQPIQSRRRIAPPQLVQHRKCVHHVADRRQLDQQDLAEIAAAQIVRHGCPLGVQLARSRRLLLGQSLANVLGQGLGQGLRPRLYWRLTTPSAPTTSGILDNTASHRGGRPRPRMSTRTPRRSRSNTRKSPISRLCWASHERSRYLAKTVEITRAQRAHLQSYSRIVHLSAAPIGRFPGRFGGSFSAPPARRARQLLPAVDMMRFAFGQMPHVCVTC